MEGRSALSAAAMGVVAAAAIWIGLALFVFAYAYRTSAALHVTLMLIGGWLLVAGTAYVIAGRPRVA